MERNARDLDSNDMEGSTSGQQRLSDAATSDSESDLNAQEIDKHGSSSESESSGESDSSIEIRHRKTKTALIDSDSDNSESDWEISPSKRSRLPQLSGESSSSESDGQSDKCPICLARFKGQEIGLPDSCEHSFCYECILEWSKNVTTCPIDRKQFQLILIKKHLDGSVVRQIPVQAQQAAEPDVELVDPTFCEICHACDREDRMLLCDGCDLGFHLECLTPPLENVPVGSWLCPDCGPEDLQDITIYVNELEVLYHDAEEFGAPANARRVQPSNNIVPRTRQSDRIRARIISNRQNNRISTVVGHNNIQVTVDQVDQPSTSRRTSTTASVTQSRHRSTTRRTTTTKKRRKKRKARKPRIKITYEIDEATGKKIVIETKSYCKSKARKRKRRKIRKRLTRAAADTKTTKRRLAKHFGICAPEKPGQTLPDVRIPCENKNLSYMRYQAGIPSLSLFGNANDIDYFSGSDDNDEGDGGASGSGVLVRRRPNMNDVAVLRRSAARKSHLLPSAVQTQTSSSIDLLGSIMDSQEKMHSKHSVLSLNKDGSLKIDTNKNSNSETNRNGVNVNDRRHIRGRNVPTYSTNDNPANIANVNSPQEYRSDNRVATSSATISNDSVSTSTVSSRGDGGNSTTNSSIGGGNCPETDTGMDPYSDIETVSTSKVEAEDSDKDESEDVIKDAQEEDVSSTTNVITHDHGRVDEPIEDTDDEECPNFSIYSKDTINLVANRSLEHNEVGSSLDVSKQDQDQDQDQDDIPPPPTTDDDEDDEGDGEDKTDQAVELNADVEDVEINDEHHDVKDNSKLNDLYSDSDEEVVKTDARSFGIGDIRDITEDISDEERSYTPCLDERGPIREGLEGLDTEAISEDEKNDFDESHEHKTISEGGDALEINAKESELDFTKPEDYEEGEIIDKLKKLEKEKEKAKEESSGKSSTTNKTKEVKKKDKENSAPVEKEPTASFKRITKNTNRNYRDKDRSRSHSREKNKENERDKKRERKKEKRKELERYNVRNLVSDKPRKTNKDKFGRDARRRSTSRSSRSPSYSPPYRSPSRGRRSFSRERRKRRGRSRARSTSRSRSRSRSRKRSASRKRRSISRPKRRRSSADEKKRERKKRTPSRHRSRSRSRSHSPTRRHREWEREPQARPRWSPSLSRSRTPERKASPSWTPPRMHESTAVKPHNLTVILTNDGNKSKKKDKKRSEKRKKEGASDKSKKRKRDKTPLPSKEVFASGDNILVSVSFNKEAEELGKRTTKQTRAVDDEISTKRTRKEKEKRHERTRTPPPPVATKTKKKKTPQQDLSGVKPVAIIDLDRSPFKELTPSPKDVIVLSDSDHSPEKAVPDSSQQTDYSMGPKTPPEPQVKFSLATKAPQLRQISNPLHDPDEENEETEIDPQDELEQRLNDALHKGPNTPSEPPNSPPSSPDAYDPFDPTKSRSPTPEAEDTQPGPQDLDDSHSPDEEREMPLSKTPDIGIAKSHTPPLADIQPADSQTNTQMCLGGSTTPEESDKQGQLAPTAIAQGNSPIFSSKVKTTVSAAASTPTSSITTAPRVNILNSTIITPILPAKPSPTKASVKMMPKRIPSTNAPKLPKPAPKMKNNRSTDSNDSNMDLDSPYSPGPSDFEDLFEPPTEHKNKPKPAPPPPVQQQSQPPTKASTKQTFDNLFGSPGNKSKSKMDKSKKPTHAKIKQVGLKFDEDSLKILDELPNSAVEMQVKDKYLKKLNRQERVVEEVKLVLKPHYNKKHINKDEYKDILRRAVPKICHNKAGEINPKKIQNLVEAYVKKVRHTKKVSSSSSVSAQK